MRTSVWHQRLSSLILPSFLNVRLHRSCCPLSVPSFRELDERNLHDPLCLAPRPPQVLYPCNRLAVVHVLAG